MATTDRNVGNISVRFSVQDAEVVRKALDALGKDGETALKRLDAAGKAPSASLRGLNEIISDLKGRAVGLAVPLGGVGSGLIALGPGGLAAAAGIGLIIAAFNAASDAAHAYAERQKELRNIAEQAGLSAAAVKALEQENAKLGITNEQTATALTKFNIALAGIRLGEGPAVASLRRINPELLKELQLAGSTADALIVLSRAYEGLDAQQRAALSREFFGRGTSDYARMLEQIRQNNALVTVKDDPNVKAATDRIITLKNELDEIAKRTANIWGGMFAEDILAAQKSTAEFFERISKSAAEFKASADLTRLIAILPMLAMGPAGLIGLAGQGVANAAIKTVTPEGAIKGLREEIERLTPASVGLTRAAADTRAVIEMLRLQLATLEDDVKKRQAADVYRSPAADQALRNKPVSVNYVDPTLRTETPISPETDPAARKKIQTPQAILADARELAAFLGAAQSPFEQYELRIKEINAAIANNRDLTKDEARAVDAAKLARDQAILSLKEQVGVAKEEDIVSVKLAQAYDALKKAGVTSAEERATAEKIVRKEAQLTAEAIKVRASDTPALTKLSQDADKLAVNLDTNLAGALRGTTSDMIAMAKGTETVGQGATNMALKLAEAAVQAVLLKNIIGPLAGQMTGLFGFLSPGKGGPTDPTNAAPGAGGLDFAASARGNVFDRAGLMAFAHGGIVNRPTLFPFAYGVGLMGEAGPEAILPLRRGAGGRLGVDAGGAGASPVRLEVHIHGAPEGGSRVSETSDGRGGRRIDVMLGDAMAQQASRPGSPFQKSMGANFGARTQLVRR